jgi:hypothetical protein
MQKQQQKCATEIVFSFATNEIGTAEGKVSCHVGVAGGVEVLWGFVLGFGGLAEVDD